MTGIYGLMKEATTFKEKIQKISARRSFLSQNKDVITNGMEEFQRRVYIDKDMGLTLDNYIGNHSLYGIFKLFFLINKFLQIKCQAQYIAILIPVDVTSRSYLPLYTRITIGLSSFALL